MDIAVALSKLPPSEHVKQSFLLDFNLVSVVEKKLIKLHERLKTNIHVHHRIQTYWIQMINEAFYLEDIFNSEKNTNHQFIKQNPFPSSWLRQKLFDQHSKLGKNFMKKNFFNY